MLFKLLSIKLFRLSILLVSIIIKSTFRFISSIFLVFVSVLVFISVAILVTSAILTPSALIKVFISFVLSVIVDVN